MSCFHDGRHSRAGFFLPAGQGRLLVDLLRAVRVSVRAQALDTSLTAWSSGSAFRPLSDDCALASTFWSPSRRFYFSMRLDFFIAGAKSLATFWESSWARLRARLSLSGRHLRIT